MELSGSVALVTGGASGLGLATTEMLVDHDVRVMILDLKDDTGPGLVESLHGMASFMRCDVREPDAVAAAVAAAHATYGRIDILVNTAGVGTASKIVSRDGELFDLDLYRFTIEVNLIGAFDVLRNVAGRMVENDPRSSGERGVIINVASIAAFDGQVGQAAYSASKGGIVGMTLPVARELGRHGIRVMTIAPGVFKTPILGMLPPEAIDELTAEAVFPKRLGDPAEFAHMVKSIIENPYLNGETVRLDAGTRMS